MNLTKFNHKIGEIRDDRTHGASELARRCLSLLIEVAATDTPAGSAAELRDQLLNLSEQLSQARPSMTPIQRLLRQWQQGFVWLDPVRDIDSVRRIAITEAERLIMVSRQAVEDCALHTVQLLGDSKTVLTHSISSTVVEVCRLCKHKNLQMIVTESRPLEEGRQWAQRLSAWQVPTLYITDAQMGLFAAQADVALVGADSVLADGSVVNKVGTYLLALAARACGIPFYVCCESFKWREPDQPPLLLEEMPAAELATPDWPGVTVKNVYFDITPPQLVSAWIDEKGVRWANELNWSE